MQPRRSGRFVTELTRTTTAVVLAVGRGSRLANLTANAAKPGAPFGGNFRIIDFPLSNCVNSGIRQVYVLTQYKAQTLIQHINRGWGYLRGELGEFIQIVPAQQQLGDQWYRGTADSVYQNLPVIQENEPEHVLVLAGDHVYKMDYGPLIACHSESEADITVGLVEVPLRDASLFGVAAVDDDNRIVRFEEKPARPEPIPGCPDKALASMGMYVFDADFLYRKMTADAADSSSTHDFGADIIPGSIALGEHVQAYRFRDVETMAQSYWRNISTVDTFFRANLELSNVRPELNLYDELWPIWTYQEQLPPAKFVLDGSGRSGVAINSLVADGCIVSGAEVHESVLFSSVRVGEESVLSQAVVLPRAVIGPNCRITRAIIDEGTVIPPGSIIGDNPEEDARRFWRSDEGVVLVSAQMLAMQA